MNKDKTLSAQQISDKVSFSIEKYSYLGLFELYAIFMGKAQLLEFCLKGLLTRKYEVPFDSLEI